MARTITEIQQQMITQANKDLPALTSTSSTAVWRMWTYLIATAIYLFEKILDADKANLETAIAAKRFGSLTWYKDAALAFQDGYALEVTSEGLLQYPSIDEAAKIIARASVSEVNGILYLKVAKIINGELVKLSIDELLRFENYMNDVRVAGTQIECVSFDSDVLTLSGVNIYYDAIYKLDDIKANLKTSLNALKTDFPFDGVIRNNKIIDCIQATTGVSDVTIATVTLKPYADNIIDVVANRQATTKSGYFNYQDETSKVINLFTFTAA